MSRFSFLFDAFRLVLQNPKLVLPKLVVAVLYGFLLLETARWSLEASVIVFDRATMTPQAASALLAPAVGLLALSVVALVADAWIATWFPVLVSDFKERKPLSFSSAISRASKRFWTAVPLLVGVELVVSIALGLLTAFSLSVSPLLFVVSLLVSVGAMVAVYVGLYPLLSVSVLESRSMAGSVSASWALSTRNWKSFSVPAALSFSLSVLNVLVAFLASDIAWLLLFWGLRVVMAVFATYVTVLNPSAYFAVVSDGSNRV